MYPRSICMPSVYSVSKSSPLDSSTVMTPSLPTFSITSAMRLPISESAAEIAATWAISSLPLTGVAMSDSRSTRAVEPRSIPCLRSIALAPAATLRIPSCTMAWASTVAVVVPSPAMSLVLVAASLSSCAPMFANGSSSSISLATVTPSWVTVGAPYFLSRATLRPFGPSVVLTAFARVSTPCFSEPRAVSLNSITFATVVLHRIVRNPQSADVSSRDLVVDLRQDVLLGEDQILLFLKLELGSGVLGEQNCVSDRHIHRDAVAILVTTALANRDHATALRLLLGRVRDDNARLRGFLTLSRLHHDAVSQRLELDGRRRSITFRHVSFSSY